MVGVFPSAVDDTVSAGKAGKAGKPGKAGKFPKACFYRPAWWLSIMDPPGIGHGMKKLSACVGVCEGHDAPVQAPALFSLSHPSLKQLLTYSQKRPQGTLEPTRNSNKTMFNKKPQK